MKVATSLADADISRPTIVSIGNFDGLHLGHQEILKTVTRRSKELGLRSLAMTFSPHPVRFLAPGRPLRLISTLEQKLRLIENAGIDIVFVAEFDATFSRLSPEEFIETYLIQGFKARSVCVGGNFNFGYRGSGTINTLRKFRKYFEIIRKYFEIIEVPPVRVRGTLVSSSAIRQLVSDGAVSRACRLLGRWIEIEGRMVPGAGRGRRMHTPTLNMESENELIPKIGVYVSRISLDGGPFMDAVTNVGVRPTFNESNLTVETFVLNTTPSSAAGQARLQFLHRLRDEIKFPSPEALQQQIACDVTRAEKFFRILASPSRRGRPPAKREPDRAKPQGKSAG
ncbi:MAG: hypothetical protein DMG15_17040 [Acidobacteria bacterium]|nr:MAG: hypothetical protein DMG15_17040 [Acidobacteriota bacterium]